MSLESVHRSTCRGQLTKIMNQATEFLDNTDFSRSSEIPTFKENVAMLIQRLKNAHENLKKADVAVRKFVKTEDMEKEFETVLEYDDKAVTVIAKLQVREKVLNGKNEVLNSTNSASIASDDNLTHGVKLKALELKKFDGSFEKWLPFWEQFKPTVHENPSLSAAAKFNFLSGALVDKAAATIQGFTPTEECYAEAVALLLEEYGNTEKIIERYIQKLLSLEPVQNNNDVQGMRLLYNQVVAATRTLSSLKVTPAQYTITLKSVILKCLPKQMRIQFYRAAEVKQPESAVLNSTTLRDVEDEQLKSLLEYMKREIQAIEKAQLSEAPKKTETKHGGENNNKQRGTATSLVSATATENCIFCNKNNHSAQNCKSSMSVADKKKILQKDGRCFRCTKKNHTSKFCKASWIKCSNCSGKHITAMCERNAKAQKDEHKSEKSISDEKDNGKITSNNNVSATLNTLSSGEDSEYFLQTAKALIKNENNKKKVFSRIVMDNGSQRTYVHEKVAKILKLKPCGVTTTTIHVFGGKNDAEQAEYNVVEIFLQSQYNEETKMIKAIVVPEVCPDVLPSTKEVIDINNEKCNEIKFELADAHKITKKLTSGINLLIGQDNYWKFSTDERKKRITENFVAVKTFFGWTLEGEVERRENGQLALMVNECEQKETQTKEKSKEIVLCQENKNIKNDENFELFELKNELKFDIKQFWNLESIGIIKSDNSKENLACCIRTVNGRYSVKLPWKLSSEYLRDNLQVALARLRSLTIKLQKEPHKLAEYDFEIRSLIEQGIAEPVLAENNYQPIYYMPNKPVYKENKTTTKTRVVFDASSSESGHTSLNDHLSEGVNLIADLFSMLIRFRSHRVAVVADIEKAFLQIELDEVDRDTHRFIWYKNMPTANDPNPELAVYRMTRVTFGVSSSPFLLASTIRKHLDDNFKDDNDLCEKLKSSFYVDDLIFSEPTPEAAINVAKRAKDVMAEAKFHLRKWNANDAAVKRTLSDNEADTVEQKVLGLRWCTINDTISVDMSKCISSIRALRATKRNVVRAMAKIFDPLGFLGPFTVRIKILLQELWRIKVQWDCALTGELLSLFLEWQDELLLLDNINIERCLLSCSDSKIELHIFADASPKAYGAVAYCRQLSSNRIISTKFVCSKNRVSPIKEKDDDELSLPKLELTAALMAARLKDTLVKSFCFELSAIFLWTDSSIALNWINGCGRKPQAYVKARVDEINKLTNIYDWRHCSGKTNPADLLTRGIKAETLIESSVWKYGPTWLLEPEDQWPTKFDGKSSAVLTTTINNSQAKIEPIMHMEKFSSLKKLLRVTAYVFRYIENSRRKSTVAELKKRKLKTINDINELTFGELQRSEKYCIKSTQREIYSDEYEALISGQKVNQKSKIASLNPRIVDGIIRLQSRFPNYVTTHDPIILPKRCHLGILLIMEAHQNTFHGGVNQVLAQLRLRYWLIQARQVIKGILRTCVTCQRLYNKSATEPWAALPTKRIMTVRPFETTGIDFAGPLYVKGDDGQMRKAYIMLFTCAALRAIHLELTPDMTTKSCIEAMRRFTSRRGVPATIMSDNAKTFKRADLELRKLNENLKGNEMQQLAAHQGIKWEFIPERAPWWGGFWERLVKSVKFSLKAAIGKANLSIFELITLLAEIEGVINSRPLTYITNDHNDLEPLTPGLFLNNSNSFLYFTGNEVDQASLTQSWHFQQKLFKRFLNRWHKDYLNQLRSIHQSKKGASRSVQVGDVVFVYDESKPRLMWKRAIVKTTFMGRDGKVRACDVQLANKNILKRSVQHLYPLEIPTSFAGAEDVKNY